MSVPRVAQGPVSVDGHEHFGMPIFARGACLLSPLYSCALVMAVKNEIAVKY